MPTVYFHTSDGMQIRFSEQQNPASDDIYQTIIRPNFFYIESKSIEILKKNHQLLTTPPIFNSMFLPFLFSIYLQFSRIGAGREERGGLKPSLVPPKCALITAYGLFPC